MRGWALVTVVLAAGCGGKLGSGSTDGERGDTRPRRGDVSGDAAVGDGAPGDSRPGDLDSGDASGGDRLGDAAGDALSGDSTAPPITEVHVAPAGSGDACTHASPCSLLTGRDVVRAAAETMARDIRVWVHDGTYALSDALALGPEDSGQNGHRIIWEPHPGDRPTFSGGMRVTGWVLHDAGSNIYRASVPAGTETRQLYVDGVRGRRARGAFEPSGFVETATGYTAPDSSMASWGNPTDIEIVALVHWKTFRCPLAEVTGNAITVAQPCWDFAQWHTGFDIGLPSWFENAYELLDEPGEWYLDRTTDTLYWIPRTGEDVGSAEVIIPTTETLLEVAGALGDPVHALTLRRLTFAYGTWLRPNTTGGYPCLQAGHHITVTSPSLGYLKTPGNVMLHHVRDVVVERCRFEHLGGSGLTVEYGSQDNQILGNVFRDISGGGIHIGDVDQPSTADPREVTKNNVVRNNFVTECGQEYYDGVGIFAGYTDGTVIDHNELRNIKYTGISVGWGWTTAISVAQNNRITHNLGAHVMQRLMDGGQIYTLSSQPNSLIDSNYFHGQTHVYGSIYLDQGTQFYTITNNVIASAPYWYILQPVVPPRAANNVVQYNVSDTANAYCCGAQGCCTEVNTISDNTVITPGQWPDSVWPIVAAAGVEPAYRDILDPVIRVEAEDYDHGGSGVGYLDATGGNAGGAYRADDVDVFPCWTCSNDHRVGSTQTGEWLAYTVDARHGGIYDFDFAVGTGDGTSQIQVTMDGVAAGTVALPDTGGRDTIALARLTDVPVAAGPHRLGVSFTGDVSLDYVAYAPFATSCDPAGTSTPAVTVTGNFDGVAGADTVDIYQSALCWDVGGEVWLSGWGAGNRNLVGDFDGDGLDDVLIIVQGSLAWHLSLSRGIRFQPSANALTGWGGGNAEIVGDFDGDGLDDVVVIYYEPGDSQWHWQLAESTGLAFSPHPDAAVGYDAGTGRCARNIDGDEADEIIIQGSENLCADLNPTTHQFAIVTCSDDC